MNSPILQPVVALVLWSFVMWAWLYATRIPAIQAANKPMLPEMTTADLNAMIPAQVRWKADNYNHLMEQPTIFYAVALSLAFLGQGDGTNASLAWAYVALRVVHTFVQTTINKIEARFGFFVLSSFVLIALTVRAALVAF